MVRWRRAAGECVCFLSRSASFASSAGHAIACRLCLWRRPLFAGPPYRRLQAAGRSARAGADQAGGAASAEAGPPPLRSSSSPAGRAINDADKQQAHQTHHYGPPKGAIFHPTPTKSAPLPHQDQPSRHTDTHKPSSHLPVCVCVLECRPTAGNHS